MEKRSCGSCTACCEGWLRDDTLEMRPGHACRHCTAQGCAIYPDRPETPCVTFECGWLQGADTFPEEMRPDRSGFIAIYRKWNAWDTMVAVPTGRSVPDASLQWLRQHAGRANLPVIFYERLVTDGEFSGLVMRAFGTARFAEAVKNAIGPQDVSMM